MFTKPLLSAQSEIAGQNTVVSLKYYSSLFKILLLSLSQMQIFFPYHYNCKIHLKNTIHIEMSFFYFTIIIACVTFREAFWFFYYWQVGE